MTTFHPKTPSKCPPKDAAPPNGIYFRIVRNNPPISKNFVIWVEEPRNRRQLQEKIKKKDCNAFAISFFTTETAILGKIPLFRRALKKKAIRDGDGFIGIAQVKLDSDSGVIKQTGGDPNHYDLWPYMNSKLECNVISVKDVTT